MSASNVQKPIEPVSILKNPNSTTSHGKTARIVLSDEEDRYISDGDNDEEVMEPLSAEALELLKTEKVLKAGYLLKKGEKRRSWKKRWFVLKSTKLAMYKDNKEYKLLRLIDLHEIHKVIEVTSKNKYKNVFAFVTAKRMYTVQASDEHDMKDWFKLVNQAKEAHLNDDESSIHRDHEFAKDVVSSYNNNKKNKPTVQIQGLNEYSVDRNYPLSPTFDKFHMIEGVASSEDDEEYSVDIQNEETKNKVLIEGYLLKLGRNKGWRKRWFVLRTDTLAYYEDDKEYSPHRVIPLQHILDSLEVEPISKNKQHCFKIITPKRSYVLCASSEEDTDSWLNALVVANRRIQKETPVQEIEKVQALSSEDSFENMSHISGVSGAGGVGGAGGALGSAPTPSANLAYLHLRASERMGRAK